MSGETSNPDFRHKLARSIVPTGGCDQVEYVDRLADSASWQPGVALRRPGGEVWLDGKLCKGGPLAPAPSRKM